MSNYFQFSYISYQQATALFRDICFCSGWLSDNFIVGLTDVSPGVTAPTLWNYDLCAQYPGVVGDGATVYLPCSKRMAPHRYLIVQIERSDWHLSFCEIEVFIRRESIILSTHHFITAACQIRKPTQIRVMALGRKISVMDSNVQLMSQTFSYGLNRASHPPTQLQPYELLCSVI